MVQVRKARDFTQGAILPQIIKFAIPLMLTGVMQLLFNTADTIVVVDTVATVMHPVIDSTAIRLALLLPLHADAMKREKNMERFYDFYAGALIAIYEKQQSGQAMEIFTYDIGKTALRTSEVLQQHPEIREAHAVVGPAYAQQVEVVLDSLQEDSVWVMIPFLSRRSSAALVQSLKEEGWNRTTSCL